MLRVLVLCEGHTEREFCNSILGNWLIDRDISIRGTLVGKPNRKRGGISSWQTYKSELESYAKQDTDRHVAVMVDYYAMPDSWPGRVESKGVNVEHRGQIVENLLSNSWDQEFGPRFHPCVQLHEFESLLFVSPATTALSLACVAGNDLYLTIEERIKQINAEVNGNIEAIDDGPETAPSKRIMNLCRAYDKKAWGPIIVDDVGESTLRQGCPWLDRWLTRLESAV